MYNKLQNACIDILTPIYLWSTKAFYLLDDVEETLLIFIAICSLVSYIWHTNFASPKL